MTHLLRPGVNAAGAILGDGWYCGYLAWLGRQFYGDRPSLLAQLELSFADGSTMVITSDPTWRTAFGPILESDFIQGEIYDARREMPGWNCAGFDDSAWQNACVLPDDGVKRVGMRGPTVRRQMELHPTFACKQPSSKFVFRGTATDFRLRPEHGRLDSP